MDVEKDLSAGINVNLGAEFTVHQRATPGSGYLWQLGAIPEGVELLASDIEHPGGDVRPGDAATQVFRFRARQAGEHTIVLVLKRRWEKAAVESRTVRVKVAE